MKVRIVGKAPMKFTDVDTGEVVQGMNLYYYAPKDEVDGYFAGQLWVKSSSPLYNKLLMLNLDKPLMAEVVYDVQPGRKVRLVLSDITLLEEKDFANIDIKRTA